MEFFTRFANKTDNEKLFKLYKEVAKISGGIARKEEEISIEFIDQFLSKSIERGLCFVIENNHEIIGEIHCSLMGPSIFSHVLSELTILVHPNFQNKGLGKILFTTLLSFIENNRPDILRIELMVRESNRNAQEFYKKLGFSIEGRMEKRIKVNDSLFEADIPMAWFNKNFSR